MTSIPRFSKDKADAYLAAIRAGARDRQAAVHAGVDEAIIRAWMGRNKQFHEDVEEAKANLVVVSLARLSRAAASRDNWGAATYMAERMEQEQELDRLRLLTTDPA